MFDIIGGTHNPAQVQDARKQDAKKKQDPKKHTTSKMIDASSYNEPYQGPLGHTVWHTTN